MCSGARHFGVNLQNFYTKLKTFHFVVSLSDNSNVNRIRMQHLSRLLYREYNRKLSRKIDKILTGGNLKKCSDTCGW